MRETRIIFEVTKDGFLTAVQRDTDESKRGWFRGIFLAGLLRRIRRGKKIIP